MRCAAGWVVAVGLALAVLVCGQVEEDEGVIDTFQPAADCVEDKFTGVDCGGYTFQETTVVCSAGALCLEWDMSATVWNLSSIDACCFEGNFEGADFLNTSIGLMGGESGARVTFRDSDLSGTTMRDTAVRVEITGDETTMNEIAWQDCNITETMIKGPIDIMGANFLNSRFATVFMDGLPGEDLSDGERQDPRLTITNMEAAGAVFSDNTHLRWMEIKGSSTKLNSVDMREVLFEFVNVREAEMRSIDLRTAKLQESNFFNVEMRRANLEGAGFRNFKIFDSDASKCNFDRTESIKECGNFVCPAFEASETDFEDSSFFRAELLKAKFVDCNLKNTDFSLTTLSSEDEGANFTASDLAGATFRGAEMPFTDLTDAKNLESVDFNQANLFMAVGIDCEEFCENRGCECNAPSAGPVFDPGIECFPASARVQIYGEDGVTTKSMAEVTHGDSIATGWGTMFSEIFFFSHREPAPPSQFIELTTAKHGTLALTKGHYVHLASGQTVAAGVVRPGVDYLVVSGTGEAALVVKAEKVWLSGLYAPHTLHGDLAVDGFRVSSYTAAVPAGLAHVILGPLRWLYRAAGVAGSLDGGGRAGLGKWFAHGVLPKGKALVYV